MYYKFLPFIVAITLFSSCSGDQAIDLKEGKWEITTTVEMKGMPFQLPPTTFTQCLNQKNLIPEGNNEDTQECKIINKKVEGSTVEWDTKCPNTTSHTKITYKYDTLNGTITINSHDKSQSFNMTSKMRGKYIGSCK